MWVTHRNEGTSQVFESFHVVYRYHLLTSNKENWMYFWWLNKAVYDNTRFVELLQIALLIWAFELTWSITWQMSPSFYNKGKWKRKGVERHSDVSVCPRMPETSPIGYTISPVLNSTWYFSCPFLILSQLQIPLFYISFICSVQYKVTMAHRSRHDCSHRDPDQKGKDID